MRKTRFKMTAKSVLMRPQDVPGRVPPLALHPLATPLQIPNKGEEHNMQSDAARVTAKLL